MPESDRRPAARAQIWCLEPGKLNVSGIGWGGGYITLTVSGDNSKKQNRVPDKQDTFRPHRQRADLKKNRISSLHSKINSMHR
jgi:hypothetical protein